MNRSPRRLVLGAVGVLALLAVLVASSCSSGATNAGTGATGGAGGGAGAGSTASAPSSVAPTTAAASTTAAPVTTKPSTAPKPGRVLVVGDSLGFSIAAAVLERNPTGAVFGMTELRSKAIIACTLSRWATKARSVDGTVSDIPLCTTWPQLWEPELARHPDTALLVVGNPGAQELQTPDGAWTRPCDPGYRERYREDLRAGLDMLLANSGRVAVTTAGYWRPPPARQVPGVDYRAFDKHTVCMNEVIRSVAAEKGVQVLDLGAWTCPTADTCREKQGDVILRPDGLHFDGPGGPIAMEWLLSQLQ